eukprot:362334-Chlamydomonas_euryale.AAC.2
MSRAQTPAAAVQPSLLPLRPASRWRPQRKGRGGTRTGRPCGPVPGGGLRSHLRAGTAMWATASVALQEPFLLLGSKHASLPLLFPFPPGSMKRPAVCQLPYKTCMHRPACMHACMRPRMTVGMRLSQYHAHVPCTPAQTPHNTPCVNVLSPQPFPSPPTHKLARTKNNNNCVHNAVAVPDEKPHAHSYTTHGPPAVGGDCQRGRRPCETWGTRRGARHGTDCIASGRHILGRAGRVGPHRAICCGIRGAIRCAVRCALRYSVCCVLRSAFRCAVRCALRGAIRGAIRCAVCCAVRCVLRSRSVHACGGSWSLAAWYRLWAVGCLLHESATCTSLAEPPCTPVLPTSTPLPHTRRRGNMAAGIAARWPCRLTHRDRSPSAAQRASPGAAAPPPAPRLSAPRP